MSILGFVKAFFRGNGANYKNSRHAGDDLAEEIREAMGPQAGGGAGGGRITGSAVYKLLENRDRK